MNDIERLTKKVVKFSDDRDWRQFNNSKDLALSVVLEAAEVLEHFQWKSKEEVEKYIKTDKEHIGEEIADVLKYLLLLADEIGIDLVKATENKMKKDAAKYPIEKAKGKHTKYNKL